MDENRFGGSIMSDQDNRTRTAADIVGESSLAIAEDTVERENKFANSAIGQALFYGTAMTQMARLGGQVEKTIPAIKEGIGEMTQFFKDRKGFREKFNNLSDKEKKGFTGFRDYMRQQRRKVDLGMQNFGVGDEMTFYSKDGPVSAGTRSLKPLEDRNKLRAFFLNSVEDYQFNPETGQTLQVNPGSNVLNIVEESAPPAGSFKFSPNMQSTLQLYSGPNPQANTIGVIPQNITTPGVVNAAGPNTPQDPPAGRPAIFQGPLTGSPGIAQDYLNMNYNVGKGIYNYGQQGVSSVLDFYNQNIAGNEGTIARSAFGNTMNLIGSRFGYNK